MCDYNYRTRRLRIMKTKGPEQLIEQLPEEALYKAQSTD